MFRKKIGASSALCAAALLAAAGHASALEQVAGNPFAEIQAIDDTELDTLRGKDFDTNVIVMSTTDLHQEMTDVSITIGGGVSTGNVSISDNAMGNFAGINTQTFVTGFGNSAAASTNVTINVMP